MSTAKKMARPFILWLLFFVAATAFQWFYYSLGPHFIQVAFLQAMLALATLYLIVRVVAINERWGVALAFGWVLALVVYFRFMEIYSDLRVRLLLLLGITLALNGALTLVIRRRSLSHSS